jgi:hypothetical protein
VEKRSGIPLRGNIVRNTNPHTLDEADQDAIGIHAKCHNLMKSIHIHDRHKALVQVVYLVGQIDSQPLEAKHRVIDENKLRGNHLLRASC